jgi:hypothetical protein
MPLGAVYATGIPPDTYTPTPEIAINQSDLPPTGFARTFEMQADEVNEAPPEPTPVYYDGD